MENNISRALWYSNVLQHIPTLGFKELGEGFSKWKKQRQIFAAIHRSISLKYLMMYPRELYAQLEHPGILISFHWGAYRLLPRLLLAAGHRVAILASSKIIERERAWYNSEISTTGLSDDAFRCIDASNTSSLRGILNAVLKEKRTVLIFLDADEGGEKREMTYERVPLFDGRLYWRTNVFKLAERFNLRMKTAHIELDTSSENIKARIVFGNTGIGSVGTTLDSVGDDFRTVMNKDWTAWENWSLLHRYDKANMKNRQLDGIQPLTVMPCVYQGKKYFLDISNRQFFEVR